MKALRCKILNWNPRVKAKMVLLIVTHLLRNLLNKKIQITSNKIQREMQKLSAKDNKNNEKKLSMKNKTQLWYIKRNIKRCTSSIRAKRRIIQSNINHMLIKWVNKKR